MKRNLFFISMFLVITLIISTILGTNQVKASTTDEEVKSILNAIPNEITLDIKESEYKKAPQIIENKMNDIFKSKGIDISNVEIEYYIGDYLGIDTFYQVTPYIYEKGKTNTNPIGQKDVKLIYSNHSNWNKEDEAYVKNIKVDNPKYFEVPLDYVAKNNADKNIFLNQVEKYYTNLIKDNTITLTSSNGSGDGNGGLNNWYGGIVLNVFKNNVLYEQKIIGSAYAIPVINIPSNITDANLKDYVYNEVSKYYPEYKNGFRMVQGEEDLNDDDMPRIENKNLYTIYYSYNNIEIGCYVLLNKEAPTTTKEITEKDETTNVKLDTSTEVVPADTKLVVEKVTDGSTFALVENTLKNEINKMYIYNISLKKGNETIQPNGKVKISIPVPNGFDTSKLVVYRIDENGNKTEYNATILNGYATFETDHFSTYVLAEKTSNTASTEESEDTNNTTSTEKSENTNTTSTTTEHKKDNTPKTGINEAPTIISSLLSMLSLVGIIVFKKF